MTTLVPDKERFKSLQAKVISHPYIKKQLVKSGVATAFIISLGAVNARVKVFQF